MKAMLLAAGRGERMRPLTDTRPKPLLDVGGKALIVHLIEALVAQGFKELVINHAWHGEQIVEHLGDGRTLGAHIAYSPEPAGALETGGGIRHALGLLGDDPFVAVNADIWTDFPFARLAPAGDALAHLILVDNPDHNPQGDFALEDDRVRDQGTPQLTFSGIGVYRPELFAERAEGRFPLAPILREACRDAQVSGMHYRGEWWDVGTRERLEALDRHVRDARD